MLGRRSASQARASQTARPKAWWAHLRFVLEMMSECCTRATKLGEILPDLRPGAGADQAHELPLLPPLLVQLRQVAVSLQNPRQELEEIRFHVLVGVAVVFLLVLLEVIPAKLDRLLLRLGGGQPRELVVCRRAARGGPGGGLDRVPCGCSGIVRWRRIAGPIGAEGRRGRGRLVWPGLGGGPCHHRWWRYWTSSINCCPMACVKPLAIAGVLGGGGRRIGEGVLDWTKCGKMRKSTTSLRRM